MQAISLITQAGSKTAFGRQDNASADAKLEVEHWVDASAAFGVVFADSIQPESSLSQGTSAKQDAALPDSPAVSAAATPDNDRALNDGDGSLGTSVTRTRTVPAPFVEGNPAAGTARASAPFATPPVQNGLSKAQDEAPPDRPGTASDKGRAVGREGVLLPSQASSRAKQVVSDIADGVSPRPLDTVPDRTPPGIPKVTPELLPAPKREFAPRSLIAPPAIPSATAALVEAVTIEPVETEAAAITKAGANANSETIPRTKADGASAATPLPEAGLKMLADSVPTSRSEKGDVVEASSEPKASTIIHHNSTTASSPVVAKIMRDIAPSEVHIRITNTKATPAQRQRTEAPSESLDQGDGNTKFDGFGPLARRIPLNADSSAGSGLPQGGGAAPPAFDASRRERDDNRSTSDAVPRQSDQNKTSPTVVLATPDLAQTQTESFDGISRKNRLDEVVTRLERLDALSPGQQPQAEAGRRTLPGEPIQTAVQRGAIQQVVDAIRAPVGGSIELRLAPEELGRVRLTITPGEAGLLVHLVAERPETLDLLRRHADVLASDLLQAGYSGLEFSFGGDSGTGQFTGNGTEDPAGVMVQTETSRSQDADRHNRNGMSSVRSLSPSGGVDLRL